MTMFAEFGKFGNNNVVSFLAFYVFSVQGSGCSTALEHTPRIREVVGSNPAGCGAFFLLFSIFLEVRP